MTTTTKQPRAKRAPAPAAPAIDRRPGTCEHGYTPSMCPHCEDAPRAKAPRRNPIVSMITAVERYAGSAPAPKLVIYFAAGTPARTMNAIMFRAAAAVELATPERERWIVRAEHRGAHDRMTVHLELATGSDDEVDRAIAVLQPIATRGEVL